MQIEPLCADLNGDSDVVALGRNSAREKRASNCDGGQRGMRTDESCFDVHTNLLVNPRKITQFMDNESAGDESDTSNSI